MIFNNLMTVDDRLRGVSDLAERLDNPNPTTYVARSGAGEVSRRPRADVSRCRVHVPLFLDPAFGIAAQRRVPDGGGRRRADRSTVVFTLKEAFGSFPVNLVIPIVPDGAGPAFREHPVGTGPYRFVSYAVDDKIELARFDDYFGGRAKNDGLILRVVPDDIMRGLELRKGTMDIVVNDLAPDIVHQLGRDPRLQLVESPGTDYQYIGLNMRDPVLQDRRVRQAIGYAIDRTAIIEHLRRGLATGAASPARSWGFDTESSPLLTNLRSTALLDAPAMRITEGEVGPPGVQSSP